MWQLTCGTSRAVREKGEARAVKAEVAAGKLGRADDAAGTRCGGQIMGRAASWADGGGKRKGGGGRLGRRAGQSRKKKSGPSA